MDAELLSERERKAVIPQMLFAIAVQMISNGQNLDEVSVANALLITKCLGSNPKLLLPLA